jgi:hypothetical protein
MQTRLVEVEQAWLPVKRFTFQTEEPGIFARIVAQVFQVARPPPTRIDPLNACYGVAIGTKVAPTTSRPRFERTGTLRPSDCSGRTLSGLGCSLHAG